MRKQAAVLITAGIGISLAGWIGAQAQVANRPEDRGHDVRRPPHGAPLTSPQPRFRPGPPLQVEDSILVTPTPGHPPRPDEARSLDGGRHHVACARRYRSYDRRTGHYAARPGVTRPCNL